jgi:hypothetical protein
VRERKTEGREGEGEARPRREGEGEKRTEREGAVEGLRGFRGILAGTLVEKGELAFVLNVDRVVKLFEGNKAERPERLIGTQVKLTLRRNGQTAERLVPILATLKVGDRVSVEAFHLGGDALTVMEVLRKAE